MRGLGSCLVSALLTVCGPVCGAENPAAAATSAPVEQRVAQILAGMTLDEKIAYIGGEDNMYIRAVERLGVPRIRMSDGPMGQRCAEPTTLYPGGIALAATWNTELAGSFGTAVGRDARARGIHIWLAPGVNIYRSPLCGRNFEYLGEDPHLASAMVVPLVRAVQAQGVLATVKHFACNNQEYDRNHTSSEVDERALREIYLPAFRAAVVDGGCACVMSAYNPLNGVHCTQNPFLNVQFLRKECGFDGVLMSDWGATYDGVAAANNGLDLEMPGAAFMTSATLRQGIRDGRLTEDTIDEKVRRILRVIVRAGFLDRPQQDGSIPLDDPASTQTALNMARETMVLLKNEGGALPLDASTIRSIAVIGPNAHPGVPQGGGSAMTKPFRSVSVLDGIRAVAGPNLAVEYQRGIPEVGDIREFCRASSFEHKDSRGRTVAGLRAEYHANERLAGRPVERRVDDHIAFDWTKNSPAAGMRTDGFSVRWTGTIRPAEDGVHVFAAAADDGIRVWLDGQKIMEDWTRHATRTYRVTRKLAAGRRYVLRIEYFQATGDAIIQFGWGKLLKGDLEDAADLARRSDAAVVCVGFDHTLETEGSDRTFGLPWGQDMLVKAVAAANPRTIVVINSGGGVDMRQWVGRIPAVVQAWYPGQEGGTALAEVLLGRVNPSGKLPATLETRLEDNPSAPWYAGRGKKTHYREGVFVGYRGFDHYGRSPQFCFGHGLSYTSFRYSDLSITPRLPKPGEAVRVAFTVTNTGQRDGAEVAQVYVGDSESPVPRPPRELKGFSKILLKPNESRVVTVELGEEAFRFFHPREKKWVTDPGEFTIEVGASSRDIRLTGTVRR